LVSRVAVFAWMVKGSGRGRWLLGAVVELAAVVVAVAVLLVLTHAVVVAGSARAGELTTVLALAAASAGATGAFLTRMSAHLRQEPRSSWLCLALLCYTLVAIPAATVGATSRWDEAAVGNIRLFAHTVFVGLIFLVAVAPRLPRWFSVTAGMVGFLAVAAVLGWVGEVYPAGCLAVTTSPVARWGLTAFWIAAPLTVMATALGRRSETVYRVGMALEVVAVAHVLRVGQGSPAAQLGLSFSLMRLFGIVSLLWVVVKVTRACMVEVDRQSFEQQEKLRIAQVKLRLAGERDHELRNGLAGLAGATRYIHTDGEQAVVLQRAVAAELVRLNVMMRAAAEGVTGAPVPAVAVAVGGYSVEEVLRDQVALRRSTGMDIRFDSDPRLRARGSAAALAQVVSNLLANCERHAPGSPVRIQAREIGSRVRIRVTDFGPGLPPGSERAMFGLGTKGTKSPGQGIGLHLSARLLRQHAGSITIVPARPDRPGCTVIIELPLALPDKTRQPEPAALHP
jgi:two-component system OmpR family sensor kinase